MKVSWGKTSMAASKIIGLALASVFFAMAAVAMVEWGFQTGRERDATLTAIFLACMAGASGVGARIAFEDWRNLRKTY